MLWKLVENVKYEDIYEVTFAAVVQLLSLVIMVCMTHFSFCDLNLIRSV